VILDFCWPQSASTAELQPFIFNKAAEVTREQGDGQRHVLVRAQGGAEDDVLKGGAQTDLDEQFL
jgi:hypothetical protein